MIVEKASPQIYLLRHGETDANKNRVIQGKGFNPQLNTVGIWQAKRVGAYIHRHFERPRSLCVSPLRRAIHTAEIVQNKLYRWWEKPCLMEIVYGLEEIDYGDLEGKTWEEIRAVYQNAEEIYDGSILDTIYPNGEKIRDVRKRVVNAFERIVRHYYRESPILIVSHGGTLRLLVSWILQTDNIRAINHSNTGLSVIEYREGRWNIQLLNSTTHLL